MKKTLFTLVFATMAMGYSSLSLAASERDKFALKILKQHYPKAKYDKEFQRWQYNDGEVDYDIYYEVRDIQTNEGKKRYVAIQEAMGATYVNSTFLYRFHQQGDNWRLENKRLMEGDDEKIYGKSYVFAGMGEAKIVKLGKEHLGFQLRGVSGGTGGTERDIRWFYLVNNQFKYLAGCISKSLRSEEIMFECEPKIRTDMTATNGFYPIELHYSVSKDRVESFIGEKIPKGWGGGPGGYISKPIGKRKGKVLIEFNAEKQAYILPAKLDKILDSQDRDNLIWNYFK